MGSPFYRPSSFTGGSGGGGGGDIGTGTKELSYGGLTAGVETGAGGGAAAPGAHHALLADAHGTSLLGADVSHLGAAGSATHAHVAAEAAHLLSAAAHGTAAAEVAAVGTHAAIGHAAIGHAALGAAAGAEASSPLIQLIMKLPGAMGMMNDFFDWLMKILASPGELLQQFDFQHFLSADLGGHLASLHSIAQMAGDHFTLNMTSLSTDTSFLNTQAIVGKFDLTHALPAEHFTQNPMDLGAAANAQHPAFEAAGASAKEGLLAGPAADHTASASFLSGNHRLFVDQIDKVGGGNQFNSMTNATSVPSASSTAPVNSNGATFGQEANSMPAQANEGTLSGPATSDAGSMQLGSHSQPSLLDSGTSSTSLLDKANSNNLLATDVPSYRPTMGSSYYQQSSGIDSSAGTVEPLKAKQLTFDDIRKGTGNHIQTVADLKKAAPEVHHDAKPVVDGISHRTLPKAFGSSAKHIASNSGVHSGTHHAAHSAPAAKSAPSAETQSAQQDAAQAPTDQVAQADTSQTTDANATGEYTVEKGDSLWNIAEKQLGDGSRWTEIYKMNTDVVGQNPDLIFSGEHLKLPGAGDQIADAGKYVVKPGDNLWDIAQQKLGGGDHWTELYKANANIVGNNPRLILPGQELSIPGAPQIAQAAPTANIAQAAQPAMQPIAAAQPAMPAPMQAAAPMEMQQAMPMQAMQSQGALSMGYENIPAANGGAPVLPAHSEMPMGPDAAGAAEVPKTPDAVIGSSIPSDLASFLERKSN